MKLPFSYIKHLCFIVFMLVRSISIFAQEVEFPCKKQLEKAQFDKAYINLQKQIQKDTNNCEIYYALYQYYYSKQNPARNIREAYSYLEKAELQFFASEDRQRQKLLKHGYNSVLFITDYKVIGREALHYTEELRTIEAYNNFLSFYTKVDAQQLERARTARNSLAYVEAEQSHSISAYQQFIATYPDATEISQAQSRIFEMAYAQAEQENTIDAYKRFLENYSSAPQVHQARNNIYLLAFFDAQLANTETAFRDYAILYPASPLKDKALKEADKIAEEKAIQQAVSKADFSGKCGKNLTWTLFDGTLTIWGTGDMDDYVCDNDEPCAPWVYHMADGYVINEVVIKQGVTSIGDLAFAQIYNEENRSISSIIIPNTITRIGLWAFYGCENIMSIVIPNSVTQIEDDIFLECNNITTPIYNDHIFAYLPKSYVGEYTIPEGIETIAGGAFSGCINLTFVHIPNSVTEIGEETFSNCVNITKPLYNDHVFAYLPKSHLGEYIIHDGIEKIAGDAFGGCKNLTFVHIPNSVTSIGNRAFANCDNIDKPVYNAHIFAYLPKSYTGEYTIPEGVEKIAYDAFSDCDSLTSIILPNSIKRLECSIFDDCTNLISITIPSSTYVEDEYEEPYGLYIKEIHFMGTLKEWCEKTWKSDITSSYGGYDLFIDGDKITHLVIPDGLARIKKGAFTNCISITSITIPNSVTTIEEGAFAGCSNVVSVTIPSSVTNIEYSAFGGCVGLTEIIIPKSVINIEKNAFYGCKNLQIFRYPRELDLKQAFDEDTNPILIPY